MEQNIKKIGGDKMKKVRRKVFLCMMAFFLMAGVSWSEETAWYDPAENWIVRLYTTASVPGYAVMLEVLDTGNNLVTDPIAGILTNPLEIAGDAGGPDVSLAFDEERAMAYVIYTESRGGVALTPVPDIVRAGGNLTVTPNTAEFGTVRAWGTKNRTVTVRNSGTMPINFRYIGTSGLPFTLHSKTCVTGKPLAIGHTCNIELRFSPYDAAAYNGSLDIISNAGGVHVPLIGNE
jgi:hypothetical protein